jgi:dihydroorotase
MKILITNALICDPLSDFNNKKCDILIEDYIIDAIEISGKQHFNKQKNLKVIDAKSCMLMPGLTDMRAHISDPGLEYKEDIVSAANAALHGGFINIAVLPDNFPVTHSKSEVLYFISKNSQLPINLLPYGTISSNLAGKELAELYDMYLHGAVGFTDANQPVSKSGLMLKALLYAKIFNGLIISHAEDKSLSESGKMHEGLVSTNLGLKGIPGMAEEIFIFRDLELAKYADAPIHFAHISSKGSVDLIRKAKKQGLKVTCDVSVAHLCYTDEHLSTYDVNFKVVPPLRSKADKKALWDGVLDGTIDCIVTDHKPQNIENKQVEFEYAEAGMSTLQTALNMLLMHAPKDFTAAMLVQKMVHNPNQILNQPENKIAIGLPANLFLFNPKLKWEYNEKSNFSKSINSPLFKTTLTGKTTWVIAKKQIHQLN